MRTQQEIAAWLMDARAQLSRLPDGVPNVRAAALQGMIEAFALVLDLNPEDLALEVHEADQPTLTGTVTVEEVGGRGYYLMQFPPYLIPPHQQRPWSAIVHASHLRQLRVALEGLDLLVESAPVRARPTPPHAAHAAAVVVEASDTAELPTMPLARA
jgi:hypothetical protein